MKQLKVLHVIGGGEFGGAERHILNLVTSMDEQRVQALVCCLFAEPFVRIARENGLKVVYLPMRHKLNLGVLGGLRALMERERVDIVHTHGVRANLVGRLAARLAGVSGVVTTVHSKLDLDYPDWPSRLANKFIERASRGLTRHFIAVSGGIKQYLLQEGIKERKITVIYNGLKTDEFAGRAQPGVFRQQWRLEEGKHLVGVVGRLHHVKGQTYFLQAAAQLAAQRDDVHFLVVGSGPDREKLEQQAGELGLTGRVTFTGFVSDVPAVLADLSLLVIPSLSEGLPLAAVEAMAAGVPVLATSVGGLPEVIQHGNSGLLVPPADVPALTKSMTWMLDHPAEVAVMVELARQTVQEKFSAVAMARRTEELYRWVLGGR
ncbi:MAG: glycosyltransferase, partial [Bacillota bacterium]|uniref:glycosyltransferase n=1 Tax=Desulfurispora thermophila TaxID=265470 RepID=UPI000368E2DE|nr:glycosyltransferase [Desulfurispora thermophila]